MIEDHWNGPLLEREMLEAYDKAATDNMSKPEFYEKDGDEVKIGFESEVAIHSHMHIDEYEDKRDEIIEDLPEFTDRELGVAQIEFRTPPINIVERNGFQKITSIYKNNFSRILSYAKKHRCSILRCGTNPFLPVKNSPRTNTPKYRLVPDYYNYNRRKDADTVIGLDNNKVDIGDASIVSLFQSFQINLEANSFGDAIDKMNRSFGIAPYLLALGANSRYLEYIDTYMQDTRLHSWEKSHDTKMQDIRLLSWEKSFDTRTISEIKAGKMLRVGLPEDYFNDIQEYLARAGRFPFILYSPHNAFNIAIGMTWLDSRIKFIENSLVVELRLLPTQPTIEEEILLTLMYLGRLRFAQMKKESLLPIELVRDNRMRAMYYGMNTDMWFVTEGYDVINMPYKEGIRKELEKVKEGLREIGLLEFLDIDLFEKILDSGTPSDRLALELNRVGGLHGWYLRYRMERALENSKMLVP